MRAMLGFGEPTRCDFGCRHRISSQLSDYEGDARCHGPRCIAAGRVNLSDRVVRGNLVCRAEAFARTDRGGEIVVSVLTLGLQFRRPNIRVLDRIDPTKAHEASLIW